MDASRALRDTLFVLPSTSFVPTNKRLEPNGLRPDRAERSPAPVPSPYLYRRPRSTELQPSTALDHVGLRCYEGLDALQPRKPALLSAQGKNCDFAPLSP